LLKNPDKSIIYLNKYKKERPSFRLLTASVGMGTFLTGNMLQIKNILVIF